MGCSRELTERNWKSNRRSCIVNTYICMHRCKINEHTLPGSTIPRNMLPLLSLRVESIWFAIDLEDGSSSADASPLVQCKCLILVSDWSTQCRAVAKWGQFATSALRVLDQNEAPQHTGGCSALALGPCGAPALRTRAVQADSALRDS